MRAVFQRVSEARVEVGGKVKGRIGRGALVLLGVASDDTEADGDAIADKCAALRVFEDAQGKLNLSVSDVDGGILLVSQFTLYGDCRKGRRPSFVQAARPDHAQALYEHVAQRLRGHGLKVETGQFQALMQVHLVNDGPVTLLIDSRKGF